MFCKNCGTKNETTDNFCKNCGTPLENIQNKKESEFEKVAKKKNNPIFVVLGIIILITILYIGRQIPEQLIIQETENVTFSGYTFKIPSPYQAIINDDTLTIISENFQDQEAIGIKIYSDGYDELVSEMKALADAGNAISDLETEKIKELGLKDSDKGTFEIDVTWAWLKAYNGKVSIVIHDLGKPKEDKGKAMTEHEDSNDEAPF